ncbi:S-layer homology domain-containing protein [Cohnella mopanensis]|uniref:S-layer homology domain-containing protein n=1 Tax=Cohnella mopanensis TaxID=2911966 RepID=UPI001EF840ED|nr:S-layer homology domain-containing protein [Cohnella mopanensis]
MVDCLRAEVISGRKGNELAPQVFITRAEVAMIIHFPDGSLLSDWRKALGER